MNKTFLKFKCDKKHETNNQYIFFGILIMESKVQSFWKMMVDNLGNTWQTNNHRMLVQSWMWA